MSTGSTNADSASTLTAIAAKLDALLAQSAPLPRFLTIKGAASYSSLSADSIRRKIERRALKAYRPVKGRILIDRQQLDQVILGSTSTPTRGRGRRQR